MSDKNYAALAVDKLAGFIQTIKFCSELDMRRWVIDESPKYARYELIVYKPLKVKRDVVVTITGDDDEP